MFNNNFTKPCLEILGQRKFPLNIFQYIINVCLRLLLHSTLNIWCKSFFKQFHKIAVFSDIPESILQADE